MSVSQKLGEKMYADQQAAAAAAGGAEGAEGAAGAAAGNTGAHGGGESASRPADDNVVDAEVKEVKKG
jgi:molecular chaperone DnaK